MPSRYAYCINFAVWNGLGGKLKANVVECSVGQVPSWNPGYIDWHWYQRINQTGMTRGNTSLELVPAW